MVHLTPNSYSYCIACGAYYIVLIFILYSLLWVSFTGMNLEASGLLSSGRYADSIPKVPTQLHSRVAQIDQVGKVKCQIVEGKSQLPLVPPSFHHSNILNRLAHMNSDASFSANAQSPQLKTAILFARIQYTARVADVCEGGTLDL